jgi:cell division protein FtsW
VSRPAPARATSAARGRAPSAAALVRNAARPRRRAAEKPIEHRLLLTATLCLLAFGAVMVYSASSARNLLQGQGDGTQYFLRYLMGAAVGLVGMQVVQRLSLETIRRLTPLLLAGGFFGLIAVLGVGVQVNGARRWLGASSLEFQPSELVKLALVLYAAGFASAHPRRLRTFKGLISPVLVVTGAAAFLVAIEPDLGTALVIGFTIIALLLAAGVPVRYLGYVLAIAFGLVVLSALFQAHQRARLTSFLHPWAQAGTNGFQAVQGQIAIGSGGLFGVGLGQSVQKIFYLPEAHTDFILAVIGEELGALGILGVLSLYGMVAWSGLRTARTAATPYAKLLAAGITSLILCQATLNIFVVLGLAPLTGVPLPFISYGPSNLVILLCGIGLLLNIAADSGGKRLRPVPDPPRRTRRAR